MNEHYTIKENRISIGEYVKMVMHLYTGKWWWAYMIPVIVCLGLGSLNTNFFFVAVILVFLVFSMIFSFVYIYHGLVPESRYSIKNKTLEIDKEGVKLHYVVDEESESPQKIELIEWCKFDRIMAKGDLVLLMFKSRKYSFLAIPIDSIEKDSLEKTILFIRDHIRN